MRFSSYRVAIIYANGEAEEHNLDNQSDAFYYYASSHRPWMFRVMMVWSVAQDRYVLMKHDINSSLLQSDSH